MAAGGVDEEEEERQAEEEFFDSREVMSPASVASPATSARHDWPAALLDVWAADPCSVQERRQRFARSMLDLLDPAPLLSEADPRPREEIVVPSSSSSPGAADDPREEEETSGAPTRGGVGCVEEDDEGALLQCVFRNLDDGTVFVADEVGQDVL